jgi:hypothetical protein
MKSKVSGKYVVSNFRVEKIPQPARPLIHTLYEQKKADSLDKMVCLSSYYEQADSDNSSLMLPMPRQGSTSSIMSNPVS